MSLIPLLRKDWRVYRAAMIGCATLGTGIYALYFAAAWLESMRNSQVQLAQKLPDLLFTAAGVGLIAMAITAAVFGGTAFARERRERWADFMTLLPPSRRRAAASKFIISLTAWSLGCAVHGVILLWATSQPEFHPSLLDEFPRMLNIIGGATAMAFGVAWAMSSRLSSPGKSASIGVVTTLGLLQFINLLLDLSGPAHADVDRLFVPVSLSAGALMFALGTMSYLSRVEP